MYRLFLLSPANTAGLRARMLLDPQARFDLAVRLRKGCATLGEAFRFCSSLYFRGKLAYAERFVHVPPNCPSGLIITTNRGLLPPDTPISVEELRQFSEGDVSTENSHYITPLQRDASALAGLPEFEFILLGSVATSKYVEPLQAAFGDRLLFPKEFIGRGDMSRGGLLLRAANTGMELEYMPVAGAVRRGRRATRIADLGKSSARNCSEQERRKEKEF